MGDYSSLLDQIFERPELLLRDRSLTELATFLHGFYYGYERNKKKRTEDRLYSGFGEYVLSVYKMDGSSSWSRVVLFKEGSEYKAFKAVEKLWFEYKQQASR